MSVACLTADGQAMQIILGIERDETCFGVAWQRIEVAYEAHHQNAPRTESEAA